MIGIRQQLKNISLFWRYRELLLNLSRREIAQRYKQSVLGYTWVILNPLFQLLVMNFVFSTVLKISSLGVPYIIFLSVGLLPWNLFTQSLTSSATVLVANSSLITKIYFPREILVFATMIAKTVDFLFSCTVLVVFLIIYKIAPTNMLWWIPLIFIIQFFFTAGIALIVAAYNLFYRDIQYVVALLLILWMYITPIIYPIEVIPSQFRFILSLNPMAVMVNAYRQVIVGRGMPNIISLSIGFLTSFLVFLIGYGIFKKLEGEFADYV